MSDQKDRILIVESDPIVSELIGRQALQAVGYQVSIVADATVAINRVVSWSPDVVITNLQLPGLSGKDLMVALSSQGIQVPVIVVAPKGLEADMIQMFRLGASDYLLWPAREAEVVAVVERALRQVHERREREMLQRQLQAANHEMQQRVRELTTMYSIGKTVTSVTDQNTLMEKILEAAVRVTQADLGWLLLREDNHKPFVLSAQANLPPSLIERMRQPWDDGVSSLVAMSGESLLIHGEPLRRFKISSLGQAAMIVPIRVQKQVIGLLVVMRRQPTAFSSGDQHLLEALADYASVSLVNARLFRVVEERAKSAQSLAEQAVLGEKINNEILRLVKKQLLSSVSAGRNALERLGKDLTARWRSDQRQLLAAVHEQLLALGQTAETIAPAIQTSFSVTEVNLGEIFNRISRRWQVLSQQNGLAFSAHNTSSGSKALVDSDRLEQAVDSVLSNAVKFSSEKGQIFLRLDRTPDRQAMITVTNSGPGIDEAALSRIFEENYQPAATSNTRFGGLGIRLFLARQLIEAQGGKMWAEGKPGQGASFYIQIPLSS
jgi:signal transduction histidine kinase